MFAGDCNWISSLASLSKVQNILLLDEQVKLNVTLKYERDFTHQSTIDIVNLCYLGMKKMHMAAEPRSASCIIFSVTFKSKCESSRKHFSNNVEGSFRSP